MTAPRLFLISIQSGCFLLHITSSSSEPLSELSLQRLTSLSVNSSTQTENSIFLLINHTFLSSFASSFMHPALPKFTWVKSLLTGSWSRSMSAVKPPSCTLGEAHLFAVSVSAHIDLLTAGTCAYSRDADCLRINSRNLNCPHLKL